MSDDAIDAEVIDCTQCADPMATLGGEVPPDGPTVVKVPEVVMRGMALTTLLEHVMRQSKIIQDMLGQATFALERARAASNDGPGAVLKMIVPVMIHRKQFLAQEMQMWALIMECAEIQLEDIRPELDEIDRLNKERESDDNPNEAGGDDDNAGIESGMGNGKPGRDDCVTRAGRCAHGECVCSILADEIAP